MRREDLEKFAFLYMYREKDRDILLGKERMTFLDFDRLLYLTEILGLNLYRQEIWNVFAGQFGEQFQQLEQLYEETFSLVSYAPEETEEEQRQQWLRDFCKTAPDFVL